MNERERLERTEQLLELLKIRHGNCRELELRAARSEAFKVPLTLRNDLEEVRERIAKAEAELQALEAADPTGAVTRRVAEAELRHAQAEINHVQILLQKRRANASELARREAGHGPGKAPIELITCLKAEQEAVEDLETRLHQAQVGLEMLEKEGEADTEPNEKGDDSEALTSVRLFIATPDGERYEAEVPLDTLVVRLQSAFLADWQPTREVSAARYTLRRSPDDDPLNPALTLEEAKIEEGATLHLVPEPLTSDAPVGLTVEDAEGNSYITKVRLDTSIEALGMAFMEMIQGGGRAVVEVARGAGEYRRLRHDATLYDERVGEGARLRILTAA